MPLSQKDCEILLSEMSASEQAHFLSILGHSLTVLARGAYEFQGPGVTNPRLLRDLNEIHHRIYAQMAGLIQNEKETFPPDVLASWVTAEDKPYLQASCIEAFERSLSRATHRT